MARTSEQSSRREALLVVTLTRISEGSGRGDWIRTSDPLRPRQVRYQAALRPDSGDYPTAARLAHVRYPPPMFRPLIAGCLFASVGLAAHGGSLQALLDDGARAGGGRVELAGLQDCRTVATAVATRSKGPGFSADTTTNCRYDQATNQSTCTNNYTDSFGMSATTVSVTTFASLADAIDEIKVIPPRRRSLRTDTTARDFRGSTTSSLVNTYDKQNRLVQEVGESPAGTFTTTYTAWDEVGRPTAGKTVTRANINSLTLAYDNAARTVTTTTDTGGQRLVCVLTFDATAIRPQPHARALAG